MRPSSNAMRCLALAVALATLAGCSEYIDRRDAIALNSGNALASDRVTHMVDPWPRDSANRDIAFNGAKMETAIERYRTNRVIQPRGIGTSATYEAAPAAQNNAAPVGQTVTQPAAPVK